MMTNRVIIFFILFCLMSVPIRASDWQFLGLSARQVLSIAIDPDNVQNICAGTDAGLYVSFDGGQMWQLRISSDASFPFLAYSPHSSDTLFALESWGSYSDGLHISNSNGNGWNRIGYFSNPRRVGFDPVNPGYIFICFPDGILKSLDYGFGIDTANNGLPDLNVFDVKGGIAAQYEAYAVGETFVAHTTDFGNNWFDMGGMFGIEDYAPNRIEIEPDRPGTLYVSCYAYFARSYNGGTTWQYTQMTETGLTPIACDPQIPGLLYAGSVYGGGVMASSDAGESFTSMNDSLGNLNVYSLTIGADGSLLAGTGAGIYINDLTSAITSTDPILPQTAILSQNYPNPFNSQTLIEFYLDNSKTGRLDIYDISGRLVKTLFEGIGSGNQSQVWNGMDNLGNSVSSGIYLYSLKTVDETISRRMILLK